MACAQRRWPPRSACRGSSCRNDKKLREGSTFNDNTTERITPGYYKSPCVSSAWRWHLAAALSTSGASVDERSHVMKPVTRRKTFEGRDAEACSAATRLTCTEDFWWRRDPAILQEGVLYQLGKLRACHRPCDVRGDVPQIGLPYLGHVVKLELGAHCRELLV